MSIMKNSKKVTLYKLACLRDGDRVEVLYGEREEKRVCILVRDRQTDRIREKSKVEKEC